MSVEDWAEIRRLHRSEGMAIKAIARVMGVSRNTVKAALGSDGPPRYGRPLRGSLVDAVVGADVFVGVSAPNLLTGDNIASMAADAIVTRFPRSAIRPMGRPNVA